VRRRGLLPFRDKALVGMVHVRALPGTPRADRPLREVVAIAVDEARRLAGAGFDAIILENMHDAPYLRRDVGPEIVAAMTAVAAAARAAVSVPLGIQILAGANRAALAVAHACGASFIRAEGFVFAAVADEGLLDEADAGPLLRYRRAIGAEAVSILADVKKKHSAHAITADLDVAETARAAAFFGADGVIVSGVRTGAEPLAEDVACARAAVDVPVFAGSGATPQNAALLLAHADGLIVGSALKRDGVWSNDLDETRMRAMVEAVACCR
jgi:membrane complex biogenesis BtpA family protein